MIAVDTNFLVYARREESIHYRQAKRLLLELVAGDRPWAIPWPCVYEFLRVVTHPRVFSPPTPIQHALEDLSELFESPMLTLLGEGPSHRTHMAAAITAAKASGNLAHDAHIAALLREHSVREFWTIDRDFRRFPGIVIRNPFGAGEVHETRVRYSARTSRS